MSYDISIVKCKGTRPAAPFELQANAVCILGPASEVRRNVSSVFVGTDWSRPAWGTYDGDGFSIEFNMGEEPILDLTLHLRGGGNAIAMITGMARQFGWYAIDCQTAEFIESNGQVAEGLTEWQAFRSQVAREHRAEEE